MKTTCLLISLIYLNLTFSSYAQGVVPPETGELIDLKVEPNLSLIKGKKSTVSIVPHDGINGINVAFEGSGSGYPGASFITEGKKRGWDLTGYAKVVVVVYNSGQSVLNLSVRADNAPDASNKEPWMTSASVKVLPAETKEVVVSFGSKKKAAKGFELDPARVIAINVFALTPPEAGSFLVKSIQAAH